MSTFEVLFLTGFAFTAFAWEIGRWAARRDREDRGPMRPGDGKVWRDEP